MKKVFSLIMVLLLAGCAGLPTEIDIKTGPELIAPTAQEFSYYTPSGPVQGATAQEIISGFLAAGTGPQNDYSVAREFLSQSFAQRWNPDSGVLIRTGSPEFSSSDGSLQVVNISVAATLDEQGRYLDSQGQKNTALRFQLQKENGEWRITSAPNLTVVTPPVFLVVFRAYSVYFFDSTRSNLISDLRWFPTRASTGTRLVNAILAGPSDWLSAGVQSAIPENTHLTIDAVQVLEGVAQVDLDANALQADALDRRLMLSQLRNTLLQLPGVRDVALSVNNSPQEITPAPIFVSSSGGAAYVMSDEGIFRAAAGSSSLVPGTSALIKSKMPTRFAISNGGNRIAIATETGIYVSEASGLSSQVTKVSEQSSISAIFYDEAGLLWIVPTRADEDIEIYNATGSRRTVSENLFGTRISAEIGTEGTKLAIVLEDSGIRRVEVLTITRDSGSYPIKLNPGLEIQAVLGTPSAVSWQDTNTIRLLETTASNLTAVSDYPLSGPRLPVTFPPAVGIKLVPGPAALSTYLLADDDSIWVLSGSSWRKTGLVGSDVSGLR
ncbi:MAG: GerMN domain-containing protein [Aquiluna sp.]|nr:GerMN domain-containing protein [Aquiluna sp.]MCF8546276.1 GerMN domain-containing protein [Aquiluna sp.]